jgi:hypothetical protein
MKCVVLVCDKEFSYALMFSIETGTFRVRTNVPASTCRSNSKEKTGRSLGQWQLAAMKKLYIELMMLG